VSWWTERAMQEDRAAFKAKAEASQAERRNEIVGREVGRGHQFAHQARLTRRQRNKIEKSREA